MRFILVKLILFFFLIGISNSTENIRFININYIVNNSEAGISLNKILDNKNKKISSELNELGKKLEKKISLVGVVKRKEFLGGASLFSDDTRSATAICLSNVKVVKISRDQILNFIESKPVWVKDLFKALVDRLNDSSDLMIINKSGIAIRMQVEDLRVMGRATQGVKVISLKDGDSIAAVAKVMKDDDDIEDINDIEFTGDAV